MSEKNPRKPVYVVRLKGVKGSVFENDTEQGAFFKATYCKVYRDPASGAWKTTQAFAGHDHSILLKVIDRVWSWMLEAEANVGRSSTEENGENP